MAEIHLAGLFLGPEISCRHSRGFIKTEVSWQKGTAKPSYEEVCYNNTGHAKPFVAYDEKRLP